MFNNITQSGVAEIAKGDAWNIASHMPPDTKNYGRKQVARLYNASQLNNLSDCATNRTFGTDVITALLWSR
jgi:hypothetical protein